ncbi:hypothetical protein Tco_0841492 [Tanacetum coccineum]|uniref:Uncharacterized protein n=1 Tax=Tanacetum coccineum TaxID=301880 RepID=A0ABQ5AWJ6_9ASTR
MKISSQPAESSKGFSLSTIVTASQVVVTSLLFTSEGVSKAYSHKVQSINGSNNWVKSHCPTTLLPPIYRVPIRKPKKENPRSLCDIDDMMKDGKLSKKGRIVTCQSYGHLGHDKLSCKGQGKPSKNRVGTSGGVFGNQGQASESQANMVGSQAVGIQPGNIVSEANGIRTLMCCRVGSII